MTTARFNAGRETVTVETIDDGNHSRRLTLSNPNAGQIAANLTPETVTQVRAALGSRQALTYHQAPAAAISAFLTGSYPADMDSELIMRRRVGKVLVEVAELSEAIEGWTGENPRKGVTHGREDVVSELTDVACAAICALEFMTGDAGISMDLVAHSLAYSATRLGVEL